VTEGAVGEEAVGEEAVGVAAFDFDGTLIAGDSFSAFLIRLCGFPRFGLALVTSLTTVFAARGFRFDRDATKADLVDRLLSGYPVEQMTPRADEHARQLVGRIRPGMRSRIEWHRAQGHRLLLVSASPVVYLEPLGRHLGFDAVMGTGLEISVDGRLSGRLEGANCRGQEKEIRVRNWLDAHMDGRRVELWAYGDSSGDKELLAMADHPHRVSRWDGLRRRLVLASPA
jgi:phosphatidylglycerophosphatase C